MEQVRLLLRGGHVVQERDENNQVTASITRGGNVGGILARTTGTTQAEHAYYHYDGSGNVISITDEGGASVANYSYDGFGNTVEASGSYASQNPYRFSTKEQVGNGLYYYGFRFYSPGMGRWINRDPLQETGGLNQYAFTANNPVNLFDVDGLSFHSFVKGFAVGLGVSLVAAYITAAVGGVVACAAPQLVPILTAIGAIIGAAGVAQTIQEIWRLWNNEDNLCPDARDQAVGNLLGSFLGGLLGGKWGSKVAAKFGFCFVAGTLILMGDGSYKPIEQVKAGDVVLSKNEATGKVEKQKVTEAWSKSAPATLLLTFSDGTTVETTDDHPFYVNSQGFVPAAEIGLGSSIVTRAGPSLTLSAKEVKDAAQVVYNFSVENTNSYFVSQSGLWTHNAKRCGGKKSPRDENMGDTPLKKSRTGQQVIARMTKEGKIHTDKNGQRWVEHAETNTWWRIEKTDMGHRTNAVTWWNQTGRSFGQKAKEVRKWMLDPDNYELEPYTINRSKGGSSPERYLDPE